MESEEDAVPGNIHLIEQGDAWEVWQEGDSMPLGSYFTRPEAEDAGQAKADADGVTFERHGPDLEPGPAPDTEV